MAVTRISGNQIATTTAAQIQALTFSSQNSVLRIPAGTQANRPATASPGTIRFNTDNDAAEIYKADDGTGNPGWAAISGGGPSLGQDSIIRTNANTISENISIGPSAGAEYTNGMSAGPITIDTNFTVTIENGGAWSVR